MFAVRWKRESPSIPRAGIRAASLGQRQRRKLGDRDGEVELAGDGLDPGEAAGRERTRRCNAAGPAPGKRPREGSGTSPADYIQGLVDPAPVHVGDPEAIGIPGLSRPDYGEPVPIDAKEIPIFWGCG
jgi:D-glutamate cyclase